MDNMQILKLKQSAGENMKKLKANQILYLENLIKTKEDNKLKTQLEEQVKHQKAKAQKTGEKTIVEMQKEIDKL